MAGAESLVSFAPLLVPVVSGLVGGATLIVKDRREKRSADHHFRRRLEKAQMEVQFITGWIEAKKLAPTDVAPDPEPGRWLDECYASVRSYEAEAAERGKGRPGTLRRLLLLRPVRGRPAKVVRALYWISFLAFNAAFAWWVSILVGGPPEFFGAEDETARPDDVEALLGLTFSFLVLAVGLWAWAVYLDVSEPAAERPSRIDSAAWAATERQRRHDEDEGAGPEGPDAG